MRKFGPRNCLIAGVLVLAVGAVMMGQVTAPWQLYLANALLAFGWAGTSLGVITNTLGLWFDRKRGMAISLALNGASFGGIIGVPLLVAATAHLGFPAAMMLAAMVMLALMIPVILIFVGRPPGLDTAVRSAAEAPSPGKIRAEALRDVAFLSVAIAFALVLFAQVGFIVHLISFLDPLIGRERAAFAVALLTAMAMAGRVLFSTVIDRLNQRLASAISFASQAAALLIIIHSRNEIVLIAACALFGFSVGNLITLPSLIVQREFSPYAFGVLISLLTAINQVTYAFGPGVIGLLRDASGSYVLPFYGCIGLELLAAVLIMGEAVIASEAKQSILAQAKLDCFVAALLAMTVGVILPFAAANPPDRAGGCTSPAARPPCAAIAPWACPSTTRRRSGRGRADTALR